MKKTRLFAMLLAGVLLCGSGAGCSTDTGNADAPNTDAGADGGENGGLTVAFSQCGNQNNWKVVQTNDMKEKIEARGYKYIYTDAQDDTAKQMSDIEDIISQKPDYLIVSPRESEGLTPALKAAMDAGIPVILVDRGINGEAGVDYTTLNSADLVWEGQTCAQYMKDQFGDARCNVVELSGTPGATSTIDRNKGFTQEIANYDNVKIIASQVGNFNRAESQKAMENLIQAYGDEIDAVFAHNDDNAIGALQAIKAAGLKPGEDIKIYSMDGQKDALQAIIDGDMELSVLCQPRFGDSVLAIIDKLEAGEEVPAFVKNEGKLYTIENAEKCLEEAY